MIRIATIGLAAITTVTAVAFAQELTPTGKSRNPRKQTAVMNTATNAAGSVQAQKFRQTVAAMGGFVSIPMSGPGIHLVDATENGWAMSGLEAVKTGLDKFGMCPSEVIRKPSPKLDAWKVAQELVKNSCGLVMIIDGGVNEPLMTAYPEEHIALVNMKALSEGVKGSGVRQDRVEKLTWRAIGHLVGCGAPDGHNQCVMLPFKSLADLDANPSKNIHPASFFKAKRYFDFWGIQRARKGIYEIACKQGWAPPPTNDIQRAIWDKVHAIPTKPIKIEYNEKRDKGK